MKKRFTAGTLVLIILIVLAIAGTAGIMGAGLNRNLILYYNFDDLKASSITDKSGKKNIGTLEGTAAMDSMGKINGALLLDGQGDVKLPDNVLNGAEELTISAWVQFNVSGGSDWQRIYDLGNDTDNNLFLSKNRTNNFNVNKNVEGFSGGSNFTDDKWYFITTVITKDSMIYYENGVEVARKEHLKNQLGELKNSVDNYIGKSKYSTDPALTGYVDEFRIYSKALSSKEINAVMAYKMTDQEIIAMESEKINLKEEEISQDIVLPVKLQQGVKVSWSSDNKNIISNEGKVTLPSGKTDAEVTLTAVIKKGKATMEKVFSLSVLPEGVNNYTVKIDTANPRGDISPTLYGLFFEDINHSADGGLYSQLVQNNSFEYDDKLESWELIKKGKNSDGTADASYELSLNDKNPGYVRLKVVNPSDGVGLSNSGYKGISVKKNAKYDFYLWARSKENKNMKLTIQIEDSIGKVISDVKTINGFDGKWAKYETELTASADDNSAVLAVYTKDAGTLDMDMVSLFPKDTWKGVKYGLRKDLVQMLQDIKPKFLRLLEDA